jgi:hypothetical protein
MAIKIFDSMLDVVAQRGVLVLSQAFGFGYLFLAVRTGSLHRDEAIIGVALVLIGACFEYLVTLAKVKHASADIEDRERENERLRAELDAGTKFILEKRKDIQKLLDHAGRGTEQSTKPAKIETDET